ncbi:MFS transporter [Bacillus spongiae]|uniref:MFS transporter n=2 Tax=Bacillus spongiae TaxID=2683610 RepID=A0ABU8HEK6_9BACI
MKHQILNRYPAVVWIRLYGELLTSVTGSMLAPFFLLYLYEQLDGNVLLSMIIIGLQPLAEVLFTIVGGGLTDRLGRKKIILFGLLAQSISMAGFIFAESVFFFALYYVLNGLGRAVYIPAQRAQIADSTEANIRSEVFALINTVASVGMTLGPVLGYFVYTQDPTLMFGLQSSTLAIYAVLVYFKLPETIPVDTSENEQIPQRFSLRTFISRHHYVLSLMIFSLPISFFYAQTESSYRIYIEDMFSEYLMVLTILASVKAVMSILCEIPLVRWSNRYSFRKIIFISYSLYFIAAISYGYSTSLSLLVITQLLLTIAESLGLNRFLNHISEIAPVNARGLYFSIYGTHWDLSRMGGPFLGGLVLIEWGGGVLFLLSAFLLLIGGIAQLILTSEKPSLKILQEK